MAGGISTKVYFSPIRGEAGEVHRFTLDEKLCTNFTYFTQKLTRLYPEMHGKEITITYTDRDGEDVRIGSDEELNEALLETQTLKQDLFKVRVKTNSDKPKPQGPPHNDASWSHLMRGCSPCFPSGRNMEQSMQWKRRCGAWWSKLHRFLSLFILISIFSPCFLFTLLLLFTLYSLPSFSLPTRSLPAFCSLRNLTILLAIRIICPSLLFTLLLLFVLSIWISSSRNHPQVYFMDKSWGGEEESSCENHMSHLRAAARVMFEGFLNNAEATLKAMKEFKEKESKTKLDTDGSTKESESTNMDTEARPASTSSEATRIYPDLPTAPQEQQLTQDMLIEQTLQNLVDMGYSNEGGWLRQLVRAKHGNINHVLEVLLPRQRM